MVSIRYFSSDGTFRVLEIDATVSQSHTKTVEVTKFPVEDGSTISDHAILRPDTLQIEGLISNTPLLPPDQMPGAARRAESARDVLEAIIVARGAVTIDTGARVHERMVLSTLTIPRDATVGDATKFSCSAEQITTVQSETVPIPKSPKPGAVKGGRQPTTKASEPVKRKVSVLKQIVDAIRSGGSTQ